MDKNWVLITGASTGIGRALANRFAKEGYNTVLVARDAQKLFDVSGVLQNTYGISVCVIPKDLSVRGAAQELFHELIKRQILINILINNAGSGACGLFEQIESDRDMQVIDLNIRALTELTKLGIRHMRSHGGGRILNVASTGSYQPGPYIGVYYASKAYVLSLSQAVRNELKGSGITVCTLCPGSTATEFSKRAGKADIKGAMTAQKVADYAYRGLIKGKAVIIPGVMNKVLVAASKLMPSSLSASFVARIQRKLTASFDRH